VTPEYLTLQAAAARVGCSYATLYKAARRGTLPAWQWGRRWYCTPAAPAAWPRPTRPGPAPGTPSPLRGRPRA
jgi:excisionase family DNA binding protein